MATKPHPDWVLIRRLGGPATVVRYLNEAAGDPERFDLQRVQNWKARGIPARVRLDFAQVFKRKEKAKAA